MRTNARTAAVTAVVLLAALTACTRSEPTPAGTATGEPSATSSPTPTPDATDLAREQDVEAARAALAEFITVSNGLARAGYVDWTPLAGLVSGTLRDGIIAEFADLAAAGLHDTGDTVVDGTEVVEHTAAPDGTAGAVVVLDACVDISGTDIVDANGTSILDPERPTRYVVTYRAVTQSDGRWTLDDSESHLDRTC